MKCCSCCVSLRLPGTCLIEPTSNFSVISHSKSLFFRVLQSNNLKKVDLILYGAIDWGCEVRWGVWDYYLKFYMQWLHNIVHMVQEILCTYIRSIEFNFVAQTNGGQWCCNGCSEDWDNDKTDHDPHERKRASKEWTRRTVAISRRKNKHKNFIKFMLKNNLYLFSFFMTLSPVQCSIQKNFVCFSWYSYCCLFM